MRTITLEEHFATPGFLDGPGRELKDQAERYNSSRAVKLIEQLCDIRSYVSRCRGLGVWALAEGRVASASIVAAAWRGRLGRRVEWLCLLWRFFPATLAPAGMFEFARREK